MYITSEYNGENHESSRAIKTRGKIGQFQLDAQTRTKNQSKQPKLTRDEEP